MTSTPPSLILLRGLPGSGKTTFAHLLSENGLYPFFSVDDYFTDPDTGKYHFRFEENYKAYNACFENVRKAMTEASVKIIVHNTFTPASELQPYFKLADQFSYQVFVATVENYHGHANVHEIPNEQLQLMVNKYKVKLI